MMVGTKVKILKVRTRNLSQWIGKEAEITGVNSYNVYVDAGEGEVKKHLTLKPGWFEILPVRRPFGSCRQTSTHEETSNFQIGDTVAPGWPTGRGRRGRIAALLENNKFQIDWADGSTGKVRGDQLLPVQSAQPETLETEQKHDQNEEDEGVRVAQYESELLRKVYEVV